MSALPSRPTRGVAWCLALAFAGLLTGCQSLLPNTSTKTEVPWERFEDARAVIERIVPYQTRRENLAAEGLDPYRNPAVTLLTYTDIVQRFAVGAAVTPQELDRGIRECLSAGKRCVGYAIAARRTQRERIGNFWLDSLNFVREVDVTGWTFNALIILVDDQVVYTVYGGQPRIHEHEVVRNPLGPLQSWGEQVPTVIR